MARYLVVGLGSIGGAIAKKLAEEGHYVIGFSTFTNKGPQEQKRIKDRLGIAAVRHDSVMTYRRFGEELYLGDTPIDGVVYAAGKCPSGGFDAEVERPMSDLGFLKIVDDLDVHATGFYYMVRALLRSAVLTENAKIVVVGSAVTRFVCGDEALPPNMHLYHYAAAKAAQKGIARGFQHEFQAVGSRREMILLEPGVVDTPFHKGSKFTPPTMVGVESVVSDIMSALSL